MFSGAFLIQHEGRNKRKAMPCSFVKDERQGLALNGFFVGMSWVSTNGPHEMKRHLIILGGILALAVSASAVAQTPQRPFAREDAIAAIQAAEASRLAASRAEPRPAHMIRYPVEIETEEPAVRPIARSSFLPRTRWAHKPGSDLWTRSAMVSVSSYGDGLDSLIPRDIDAWCPAYRQNNAEDRRAFWVGMMSALAKHESTYNPRAVGGPDLWYGLLQIYPPTARGYGCRARTGEALKNPTENLSCAARIMNVTVARDNAIALHDGRWRGVAADWGPMSNRRKIPEMSAWTRAQDYCRMPMRPTVRPDIGSLAMRPEARPLTATVSTMDVVLSE